MESELSDEAVLEDTEATLDPSFGLWRVGRDGSDAEVFEDPSEVSGEANAGDLLLEAPVVVGSLVDGMAVLVDGEGLTVSSDDHVEEAEIPDARLMRDEDRPEKSAVGVVDGAHETTRRVLWSEPSVRASVPLHHDAHPGSAFASGPVLGRAAPAFGWFAGRSEDPSDGLPAEVDVLPLLEHLGEVGVVEVAVCQPVEGDDPLGVSLGERMFYGSASVPVSKCGGSTRGVALLEAPGLTIGEAEQHGGLPECKHLGGNPLQYLGSMDLSVAQNDGPLHVCPLLGEDIFSLQLLGT